MSSKLRDFIRNIRSCRTAADERAVIAKECALIRTAFKVGDNSYRHRNVAKLLFINMMGYPTHFGQLECLKLIASQRFAYKRIGYLGLHQVLDENTEVLMLVTNSIKNDLHHPSQYVNGLALAALGNMASPEMCLALAKEVEDLCCSGNPYIRKKAILCAIRLVKKVQDISERFICHLPSLLEEKSHGVLLATCAFIGSLIDSNPEEYLPQLRSLAPQLITCLKRVLLMPAYSSSVEYDVSGVIDPFLQVRLLQVLRKLHIGNELLQPSEDLADLVAHITSTTECNRGAGNAVLLEAVHTVLAIKPDTALRTLATNILGRLLQNKDSNIKYVALSALRQVIQLDAAVVQRHLHIVIECLKDPDTSIRRRALEVVVELVNEETIDFLFKELQQLLVSLTARDSHVGVPSALPLVQEDTEFKYCLVTRMCYVAETFAPTRRWQVDAIIKILSLCPCATPVETKNNFVLLLSITPELQGYTTVKLFFTAKEHPSLDGLLYVTLWAIGEFGDLMIGNTHPCVDGSNIQVTFEEVLTFLETSVDLVLSRNRGQASSIEAACSGISSRSMGRNSMLSSSIPSGGGHPSPSSSIRRAETTTRSVGVIIGRNMLLESEDRDTENIAEALLTCLLKLSARIASSQHLKQIRDMIQCFATAPQVELQQRSTEYVEMMGPKWESHKATLLERIPVPSAENQVFHKWITDARRRPIGDFRMDDVLSIVSSTPPEGTVSPNMLTSPHQPQFVGRGSPKDVGKEDLLDLNDLLGISDEPESSASAVEVVAQAPSAAYPATASTAVGTGGATVDELLASIFNDDGGGSASSADTQDPDSGTNSKSIAAGSTFK